jgi:hypothetical protein
MDFIIDGNNINEELMREILGELKWRWTCLEKIIIRKIMSIQKKI